MRRPRPLPAALALAFLACGGGGPGGDPGLSVEVGVSPTPATVGPGRVLVAIADSTGAPVEGAAVVVTGMMTHPGMASVVDSAVEAAPGRYVAADFPFGMAGDWVLEVRGRLPDGRLAAADHPIRVVGPPP